MSKLSDLISEVNQHTVTFKDRDGKALFDLSLLITIILCLVAPQLAVLVLILYLLDVVQLDYDGKPIFTSDQNDNADEFVEKAPS